MGARERTMQNEWQAQSATPPGKGEGQDSRNESSDDFDEFSDTTVLEAPSAESDNVGGSSVEIDAEQLLAEVEAEAAHGVDASGRVRKRLEAIMERKRRHEDLIDFDEYDLDS